MLLISLLGEQAVVDDTTGRVLSRSSRAVALVGYLVVHAGVPQPRARVAAALWPDSSDAQALTNLRRELHSLRQALAGEPALEVTSTHLAWHDTDTSHVDLRGFRKELDRALAPETADAQVVEHGLAALAEHRGDLLPGVHDDWVVGARDQLDRDVVRLCDAVADAAARTGDLPVAVDVARRRIQLAPLEEVGYRRLMELQAELGDRAGAISTYHHCASVLERELGVEPDAATTGALERLIGGEPSAAPTQAGRRRTARSGPSGTVLVAREAELARLAQLWRTAGGGRAVVALVHGGPGVGKTRLVTELAELAKRDGAAVAAAQCFDTQGRLSLGPVAEWLRTPPFRNAGDRLPPLWRAEVDRLVPPSAGRDRTDPASHQPDLWQRHRFFEGLARALGAVDRPTCLVLDNAQWCDEDTLTFLSFLLHHSARSALMLALTLRTGQDDGGDDTVLGWLSRTGSVVPTERIDLEPLDRERTAVLAESLTGRRPDDSEAELLHAATGGFPLYVVEAARSSPTAAPGQGTPSRAVSDVLVRRLAQTSPAAQELAGLAAALGRDFTLPLLTEASDLEADAVAAAVDELWRHRIVRELGAGYDFSHDLLRETAYAQVSPPRRWLLHRRLAQALELTNAAHLDEVAAHLAEQYWRAGNPDRALTFYLRAARAATALLAHAESIRLGRTALELVAALPAGQHRDAQELGCLEALAPPLNASRGYSSPELQETFERTVVLARRLSRDDSWVIGSVGLWQCYFVQGRTRESHGLAGQVLDRVRPGHRRLGQTLFSYAGSALSLGLTQEALAQFDAACVVLGDDVLTVGTRGWVHARAWSAHAAWLLGDAAGAAARAAEALARARESDHAYTLAVALAYACLTHQLLGEREQLAETAAEAEDLCDRNGFAYYVDWARILDGWRRGGPEGIVRIRQGVHNLQRIGAHTRMPFWLALLADLQRDGEAEATLDAALVGAAAREDHWWEPELMRLRARYDAPGQARKRLTEALARAEAQHSLMLRDRCAADLADLPAGVRRTSPAPTTGATLGER